MINIWSLSMMAFIITFIIIKNYNKSLSHYKDNKMYNFKTVHQFITLIFSVILRSAIVFEEFTNFAKVC